jgi:hypothetical protein
MTRRSNLDAELLERYVGTFERFDSMEAYKNDPPAVALAIGVLDAWGFGKWHPVRQATDRASLESLYATLPFRLPPLYEQLILSYRWAEVDLNGYRLLANPPGEDLSGVLSESLRDKHLFPTLLKHGYLQFAKGEDMDYDPVCFDCKRRRKNGDSPVVKIDHEEILCNERLVVVRETAAGFRELVQQTIQAAEHKARL